MRHSLLCIAIAFGLLLSTTAFAADKEPQDAGNVRMYTAWSPSALYIAFRVDDPMVVGNQTLPLSQPWLDDAVAVYLDLDPRGAKVPTPQCLRIIISAAGGATVQRGQDGQWRDDPTWFQLTPRGTIRYAVNVKGTLNDSAKPDTGYEVEIGLSWDLLGVQPPFRQRANDPLPAIGLAGVCYSQGETQAVSCWPQQLGEEDLSVPSHWGALQFGQNFQPLNTKEPLASASLTQGDPLIDGNLLGTEWINSGVQIFAKHIGQGGITISPTRHTGVSLIATWYQLAPTGGGQSGDQPMEPSGPWATGETPLYHLLQIREIRRAGIDALAVVLPADPQALETTRVRLAALVNALQDYARANTALYQYDAPMLMPVIDCTGLPDGRALEPAEIERWLNEFYRLVPPQHRLMVPDAGQRLCYPVVVTANSPLAGDAPYATISDHVQSRWGASIGWMLDTAMQPDKALPNLLTVCDWRASSGLQNGDGPVSTSVIMPGTAKLSRRDGELYENGWLKIAGAAPDFVLIHSWNDFAAGTAIAMSRRFGYQFVDATKLASLRLATRRGFGVRVLQHNLPAILRPGQEYPVEVIVKNGSVEKMVTREGFRIDYRILRDGEKVAAGTATEQIVLLELSTARFTFTLNTMLDKRKALPAGQYRLDLDFRRNKVPYLNLAMLTQTLGTVSIPFTVASDSAAAQVVRWETPTGVPAGASAPAEIDLRNLSGRDWKKGKASLRLRWATPLNDPLPGGRTIPMKDAVAPGELLHFSSELPPAPAQPGWYNLQAELLGVETDPVPVYSGAIAVSAVDLRAHFLSIELDRPEEGAKTVEAAIALRNSGMSPWPAKETLIRYRWLAWDGQPLPGAEGTVPLKNAVKAGGADTLRAMIDLPPGSGTFRCAFTLESRGKQAVLQTSPPRMAVPMAMLNVRAERYLPLDLKDAFNDWAGHADLVYSRADLDGEGNAFPLEEFLPDVTNPPYGYKPGYGLATPDPDAPGFKFSLPQQMRLPMVRAKGQAIPLTESPAKSIYVAALTTGDTKPVAFTVKYADDSEETIRLTITNWLAEPAVSESVLLQTRFVRTLKGDNYTLHGHVSAYRIPVDPARKVKELVLPDKSEICLFAITLETAPQE